MGAADSSHYISRRVQIHGEDNQVVKDTKFLNLSSISVILGEPGSGKTEFCLEMGKILGGRVYNAEIIPHIEDEIRGINDKIIFIDGMDELKSTEHRNTIRDVLATLRKAGIKRFVLACRAADWAHDANLRSMSLMFDGEISVGGLIPFDEKDAMSFISDHYPDIEPQRFMNEAYENDAFELIGNPQSLKLLVKAVVENGWPGSKSQLFEDASKRLAKEHNPTHVSLHTETISVEKKLQTAGFVCAQLLFSGLRDIRLEGLSESNQVMLQDLMSTDTQADSIKQVLSTGLFKPVGSQSLTPVHRTVAEYLAAKWIVSALSNSLSLRRLQNLLCMENNTVATSLRGLNAWLSSLELESTRKKAFIKNDAYGCFRYGDLKCYSNHQIKILLEELKSLSEEDPYFIGEDWQLRFGQGIARNELKDEILDVLVSDFTKTQLLVLILFAIEGSEVSSQIKEEIEVIALD